MGVSRSYVYIKINCIIDFIDCHRSAEMTREELEELKDMEPSLIGRWNDVLCLIGDEQNNIGKYDHSFPSGLGMAVGYTHRNAERFIREAIGAERTPVASKTGPDDVTKEVKDTARLELLCVQTWVLQRGTRETIRETGGFLQHREAITEPDVHGEEIDIRMVTVTSEDNGGSVCLVVLVVVSCFIWCFRVGFSVMNLTILVGI